MFNCGGDCSGDNVSVSEVSFNSKRETKRQVAYTYEKPIGSTGGETGVAGDLKGELYSPGLGGQCSSLLLAALFELMWASLLLLGL